MRPFTPYMTALLSLLLCSCATHWYKPGATKADSEQDLSACQVEAYERIPVHTVSRMDPGETTHTHSCSKDGKNCTDTIISTPPHQVSEDANQGIRRQYIRACMFRHGWTDEKPDK